MLENITKIMLISAPKHNHEKELVSLKGECKILMMLVLADRERSPFLKQIHSERSAQIITSLCEGALIRCIQVILSSNNDVIEKRAFVLRCFNNSPTLFSQYFRVLQVPDPAPSFQTISFYSQLTFFIDNGPKMWNYQDSVVTDASTAKAVMSILPKSLTKNVLTKTLQSSNAFLIVECLKTVAAILKRLSNLILAIESNEKMIENCTKMIFRRLPDLQVFLSTRAKFDPFAQNYLDKLANVATVCIWNIIEKYTAIFLSTLSSLQFDWIKLLPNNAQTFCSTNLHLQSRLLKTLIGITNSYQVSIFIYCTPFSSSINSQ